VRSFRLLFVHPYHSFFWLSIGVRYPPRLGCVFCYQTVQSFSSRFTITATLTPSVDNVLSKFWTVEEPSVPALPTTEDQLCEQMFAKNTYNSQTPSDRLDISGEGNVIGVPSTVSTPPQASPSQCFQSHEVSVSDAFFQPSWQSSKFFYFSVCWSFVTFTNQRAVVVNNAILAVLAVCANCYVSCHLLHTQTAFFGRSCQNHR